MLSCFEDEAIKDGASAISLSLNKTVDVHCMIDVMDHMLSCELPFNIPTPVALFM